MMIPASICLGALGLLGVKKYMGGGKCSISKDLTGKVAIITGANSGIGLETARVLAGMGCRIIFGARDQHKNEQVIEQIQKEFNQAKITAFSLDLADKESISEFARNVDKTLSDLEIDHINFLVNNAGVMAIPTKKLTNFNIQMQIGVNYFGHFYLTHLLWKKLANSGNPRIINLSSLAHRNPKNQEKFNLNMNDINFEQTQYDEYVAYSRSKLAPILFSKELQRRMDQAGINGIAISLHPGMVRTNLPRHFINSMGKKILATVTSPLQWLLMKSSLQGAQTTLYGCLADQEDLQGGQYYADCKVAKLESEQAKNQQAAIDLWNKSEEMMEISFDI